MAHILTMPEVLTGATEARLSTWTVAVGDAIADGDAVAEVETDKAVVDLPSTAAGTVGRLLVDPGTIVDVGTPLLVLLADGESLADVELPGGTGNSPAMAGAEEQSPSASAAAPVAEQAWDSAPSSTAASAPGSEQRPAEADVSSAPTRLFASPIARRMAREREIDLASLRGTGPAGRITRRDIDRHIAEAPEPTAPTAGTQAAAAATDGALSTEPSADELVPHSRMRRTIARRLTESKSTIPHFYLRADCRVDELLDLRRQINEFSEVRVSVNDLIVRAAARAFVTVPEANVRWTENGTLHLGSIDIAVAVSTGDGLLTPIVRRAATRPLTEMSRDIKDLATRSRSASLRQHELEGGSLTVSNLGMHGTSEFGAIINPPQCGILAVGAAEKRPLAVDDTIVIATMLTVTLSADHRVLDGDLAARWLSAFVTAVESPVSLLV
jgi:pyruvate dehydrogenase E2 component (dihydrolipoamide acetyltransferase)